MRSRDKQTKNDKPNVFCFVTPFASSASVRHAEKLLNCLSQTSNKVYFAGDKRIKLTARQNIVERLDLQFVHYVSNYRPRIFSWFIWIIKFSQVILSSSWYLIKNYKNVEIVICFLGLYYTPILICARLLGLKAISFEPSSDMIIMERVYQNNWWWNILKYFSLLLRKINRTIADYIVIESLNIIQQGELQRYRSKLRQANLYVDTDKFREIVPFSEREPTVGYLGRLSIEKGIRLIIDAATILSDTGYKFKIVGDGPLREEVESIMALFGRSRFEYCYWLEYEDVPKYLNSIRLLVLPSFGEGLPNVVLEAMACSTPVLVSQVGGIPDLIIDGQTGFLLSKNSAEALASKIIEVIKNPNIGRIGRQGKEHIVNKYSLRQSVEKWKKLFDEIK